MATTKHFFPPLVSSFSLRQHNLIFHTWWTSQFHWMTTVNHWNKVYPSITHCLWQLTVIVVSCDPPVIVFWTEEQEKLLEEGKRHKCCTGVEHFPSISVRFQINNGVKNDTECSWLFQVDQTRLRLKMIWQSGLKLTV